MIRDTEPSPEFKDGPVEDLLDLLEDRFAKAHLFTDAFLDTHEQAERYELPEGAYVSYEAHTRAGRMSEHIMLASSRKVSISEQEIISHDSNSSIYGAVYHVFRPILFTHPSIEGSMPDEGYRPRAFVVYLEVPEDQPDACFLVDEFGLRPIDFADREVDLTSEVITRAFDELLSADDNEELDFEDQIDNEQLVLTLLSDIGKLPPQAINKAA